MTRWLRLALLAGGTVGFSAILFLILLDGVIMPSIVDVDMVTVPDVRDRAVPAARDQVSRKGLRLAVRDSVYSETAPNGQIVEQMPRPGERIKRARRVFVDVSRGQRLYQVPQVTGVSQREAGLQLQSHQLHVGDVRYVSSTTIPEGVVASQRPAPDTRVPRATRVDLDVSSGSPFAPKPVPDLVGLTIDVVEDSLSKYEMALGTVLDRVAELLPPGQVLSQSPEGGTRAPRGTVVDLVVSVRRAATEEDR